MDSCLSAAITELLGTTMAQRQNSPTPRRLLARVRDVMAGAGAAQERLDEIVIIIATDMVAEVCSIYVRRAGEVLELFATQGLQPTAVHQTLVQNTYAKMVALVY